VPLAIASVGAGYAFISPAVPFSSADRRPSINLHPESGNQSPRSQHAF